ncbi:MAG: hypothetical protein IPL65_15145 [Lewinellaceae bacterium]|nr:hypothetical protein [Lewinellaceae bacterium]
MLIIGSCVTTKKKGEAPSKSKKAYHDLTAKYNYWFNADELLNLTIDNLESQHKDNYNQILEIYPYADVSPDGSRADLDNVIKKSSMAIGLHRVSDYTDDCYTMIGQAQFLKNDFETAESTFKWIKQEYNPRNKKPVIKKAKRSKKHLNKKKKAKKKKPLSKRKKNKLAKKRRAEKAKQKKEGITPAPKTETKKEEPKKKNPLSPVQTLTKQG